MGIALLAAVAGCTAASASPAPPSASTPAGYPNGESMPGPAWVWLTTSPKAPDVDIAIVVSSPTDPAFRLVHTFPARATVEGSYFLSEGRYVVSGMERRCETPLSLAIDDEAQVLLTMIQGGCTLTVAWQGNLHDAARPTHGHGISVGLGAPTDAGTEPTSSAVIVDQARAAQIARDYFATAHGAGNIVTNVMQVTDDIDPNACGSEWEFVLRGTVTEPSGVAYGSVMYLCVNPYTGVVTRGAAG